MDDLIFLVFVVLVLGTLLFYICWSLVRSHQMLKDWAAASDLKVVSAEFCWIDRGPFPWTTSRGQAIYRFTVANDHGERRSGWARCGTFWGGLFKDRVDVRWDKS